MKSILIILIMTAIVGFIIPLIPELIENKAKKAMVVSNKE